MSEKQLLIDALADLDRDNPPRCMPDAANSIRRAVTDRSAALGTMIWQLARFVRLLSAVSPRSYLDPLYEAPLLRRTSFQARIALAHKQGRLPAAAYAVSQDGVVFLEPELSGKGGAAFDLPYSLMPRLAGLLDVLHMTLGFAEVEAALNPMIARERPQQHADQVSNALRNRFNAFHAKAFAGEHERRQYRIVREHLRPSETGPYDPDAITDESILAFWTSRAEYWAGIIAAASGRGPSASRIETENAESEGFRRYRSVARALLRYRQVMADVRQERELSRAADTDYDEAMRTLDSQSALDWDAMELWTSPLKELMQQPAGAIKWLTLSECAALRNAFGDAGEEGGADAETSGETDPQTDTGSLFPGKFDPRFGLTLLRAEVFASAQARISQNRKRSTIADAITGVFAAIPGDAYAQICANLDRIRAQLAKEALCSIRPAIRTNPSAALYIVATVCGAAGASALSELKAMCGILEAANDDDEARDAATAALMQAFASAVDGRSAPLPAMAAILKEVRAAMKAVNRLGFRSGDEKDPAIEAAFGAAAGPLVRLWTEIGALLRALEALDLSRLESDKPVFAGVFASLYAH